MTVLAKTVTSPPPTSLPPVALAKPDVATLMRVGTVAEIQTFLTQYPGAQSAVETAMARNGRAGDLGAVIARGAQSPTDWAAEVMSWTSPSGVIMRVLQPIAASSLRQSRVGAGTDWGKSLQQVLDDPRSVPAFQAGFNQGLVDGGKSMVEGAWSLVKAGYNVGPLGWLVEGAQKVGLMGDVPSWVPDAGRVIEPASKIATGIGNYASEVSKNPARFGDDVKAWIGAKWNSLKTSHAAAAAKGGAAEAAWWGRIAGRATFEIAAVVVPVTKVASATKAAQGMTVLLKAGNVGEVFSQAARAGKLAELVTGAVKAGKLVDVVADARTVGKLAELVAAAKSAGQLSDVVKAARATGGIEGLFAKGGLGLSDVAMLQKAGAITNVEALAARTALARAQLREMLAVAPKAKVEADALADRIAKEVGGTVAKAPLKSESSALRKIMNDYAGDARRIKDLARNTVIVDQADIPGVVARLQAAGAKVKVIAAATDPLGYSGVNATFKTASGITAEIQVNTAKMIFAKETVTNARAILGNATYDAIAKEVGVAGGKGHTLYEAYRVLAPDSAAAKAIAAESKAYYALFY